MEGGRDESTLMKDPEAGRDGSFIIGQEVKRVSGSCNGWEEEDAGCYHRVVCVQGKSYTKGGGMNIGVKLKMSAKWDCRTEESNGFKMGWEDEKQA